MLFLIVAALHLAACSSNAPSPPQPATRPTSASSPASPAGIRIVSLSPAISRALVDLHLQDLVVGRTQYCKALDEKIPAVGDLMNVDFEQLVRLKPTHLLVQPQATGMDPHLEEVARQQGWTVGQWRLNGVSDIEKLVREMPDTLFAKSSSEHVAASARSQQMLDDISRALKPGDQPLFDGRVLIVYETYPVRVFGQSTYLSDVLKALGGKNAVDADGWLQYSLEDVVRINPDGLIILRPGATADLNVASAAGPLWDLDISAINNRLVTIMVQPDAFLPSTSVVQVADELRSLLLKLQQRRQ